MGLSREAMLERMYASDKTSDGQFITGVITTGIYCLPSCPARKPNAENVRFFLAETEARKAGLRACKRCRPDHFYRQFDPDREKMTRLATQVRCGSGAVADVSDMARISGLGVTKLNALVRQHYHTTPADFLNQSRIRASCRLLSEPGASVTDTAFAVGFESLSAFHENFRSATGLTPGEYQNLGRSNAFALRLPENYLGEVILHYHGRDRDSLTERVTGNRITKPLCVPLAGCGKQSGSDAERPNLLHLDVCAERAVCTVETGDGKETIGPEIMRRAHQVALRMLGLQADPAPFERRLARDPQLVPLIEGRTGLHIPLSSDAFEALIWAIVGQQVNLPFAYRLRRTLAELCGSPVTIAGAFSNLRAHPTAQQVAELGYADLTARQYSRRKAEYLIDTARAIVSGELDLDTLAQGTATQAEQTLLNVRGLGPWSVNYVMMRGFGFADCTPIGDSGLRAALKQFFALDAPPASSQVATLMERFAPFRSLATYHLWHWLSEKGKTRDERQETAENASNAEAI